MLNVLRVFHRKNNKIAMGLAMGLIVMLLSGAVITASRLIDPIRPKLQLSAAELDFGNGKPGETKSGELKISNLGNAPLLYSVHKSCGCTRVEPTSGRLLKGESQIIKIHIDLPGYVNSEKSASVKIESNDEGSPITTCRIIARSLATFRANPSFIELDTVLTGEMGQRAKEIIIEPTSNTSNHPLSDIKIKQNTKLFYCNMRKDNHNRHKIVVTQSQPLSSGDYYDTLELVLPDDVSLNIPIHLRVVNPLTVIPSTVYLKKDIRTKRYNPVELLIGTKVNNSLSPMLDARVISGPNGVSLIRDSSKGGVFQRYQLQLEGKVSHTQEKVIVGSSASNYTCEILLVDEE